MATGTKKYTVYDITQAKFIRTDTASDDVAFHSISVGGASGLVITQASADVISVIQGSTVIKVDGVDDPVTANQAANKKYVDGMIDSVGSSSALLGVPTDGTYTDGLLGFTPTTHTNDAVDDINEVLKYLAPAQGYMLSSINGAPEFGISGTTRYSTPHIVGTLANGLTGVTYKATDTNGGTRTDVINDNTFVLTTPLISSKGWRAADTGNILTTINGSTADTINLLASFNESNRETGQVGLPWVGGNSILRVTRVGPTNSFPKWQDGDASITIGSSQIRAGWNTISLTHDSDSATFNQEFWYSPETVPTVASAAINAASTNQPNTGATTRYLSGVQYYNAGTFNSIACNVNNAYGTTYPTNDMVISCPTLNTITVATPVPTVVSGSTNVNHTITGQTASIQASQRILLGSPMTVTFQSKTNYSNNGASTTQSLNNILIDSYATDATATTEYFDDEVRRYASNTNFNNVSITPNWDSTQSLLGIAGYVDGLHVYGGNLIYPAGNFSTITAPAASPNYSTATGRRYYVREFKTGVGMQNFQIQLVGVNGSDLSATTGALIFVEMALPTQTTNGSTFEFKDCVRSYISDTGIGCVSGALPSGASPTWTFTSGTKSTANSGGIVLIRISYPQGSVKQISQINFTFVS